MDIRRALPREAPALSSLALQSKAVWGYDGDFMRRCRQELTLQPAYISAQEVYVVEDRGLLSGFYGLSAGGPKASLDFLFVETGSLKRGYGRKLWLHAVNRARLLGAGYILIDADPFAEGFYLSMGAERIGAVPSGSIPGRQLPLMRYTIPGNGETKIEVIHG